MTSTMERDNDTWLADLRAGGARQQEALEDLRRALLRGLRRGLAGRRQADHAFLDDAVQDALVRILERLEQFEGRSRFVTWATSIAIRTALSELRRRRWRDVSLDGLLDAGADPVVVGDPPASPEASRRPERRALVGEMYRVIDHHLSDRQRTALLAELKGMPLAEIARHLDSNRNAVYKLTHDARRKLKRGLEAAGYRAGHVRAAFNA